MDHLTSGNALAVAKEYNELCGCSVRGTYASSDADKAFLISNVDVVFCTAKAGIEVLNASVLAHARELKVAGDVNAVLPLGIEGVKLKDFGAPLVHATASQGAVDIGALAVGDIKYKLQQALLRTMLESEQPVYLDFRDAFQRARDLV